MRLSNLFAAAILFSATAVASGENIIDFNRDIRPILADRCFKCHGPDEKKRKAKLRLDVLSGATKDLGGHSAVEPGEPDRSELLSRVTSKDNELRMPPVGSRLTPVEIRKLRTWIAEGAEYRRHWAYIRPDRPRLPEIRSQHWPRNAIDHFTLAELERRKLAPSPAAEVAILIRRLYLDLIGLPPTVEQVKAFAADPADETYEQTIDRLLGMPQFGEKWARHWLDLARYADSNGYHHDDRRSIWPYRDWVVNAINEDKPFDQFTIEQLAGDLIKNASLNQRIATGFHRNTPANLAGGSKIDEVRASILFDRVNTTGTVWLGATLECAQCHDHKFDPYTMNDYYGLFAFFNNDIAEVELHATGKKELVGESAELPVSANRRARHEMARHKRDALQPKLDAASARALGKIRQWEETVNRKTLPANIQAILRSSKPESRNDVARKQIEKHYLSQQTEVRELQAQLKSINAELKSVVPPTSLVLAKRQQPRETYVYLRGNFMTPGAAVPPTTPKLFPSPDTKLPTNRLDLARWLVSPQNPLVGRVTVNRWWNELFGQGIVETTEDFGVQGALPTHPELLDWLAVEFIEHEWSMKHVLKLIVMSATYRQSSNATKRLLAIDPENRLLARGPRFRLSAEAIRDNALAISGLLLNKLGGPPVHPPQPAHLWKEIHGIVDPDYPTATGPNRYRRGLYTVMRRGAPYPSYITFDAPNRSTCSTRRIRTNSPLQALILLNDPVFVEAAKALAKRIDSSLPTVTIDDRVRTAFRLCVARAPTQAEAKILSELYLKKVVQYQDNAKSLEALLGKQPKVNNARLAKRAAWFHVASVLLNLDETVTKR